MTNILLPYLSKRYEEGVYDCVHFTADILKELTGVDYLPEYRQKYDTIMDGYRIFARKGCRNIEEAVSLELGREPVPLKKLKAGDVVSCDSDNGIAIGICNLETSIFLTKNGLLVMPTKKCRKGWNINGRSV